jgi:hypothetical protein
MVSRGGDLFEGDDSARPTRRGGDPNDEDVRPEIPGFLLQGLIKAGKAEDIAHALAQNFPRTTHEISTALQSRAAWTRVARMLSEEDLTAAIRALTISGESMVGWGYGSVSPVIPLFYALDERFPDAAESIDTWILEHTSNRYLDFGRSRAPWVMERKRQDMAAWEARQEEIAAREREDRQRRANRASSHLYGAIRRGDVKAVAALRAVGADPSFRGPDGRTCLELAHDMQRSCDEILALLRTSPDRTER